MRTVRSKVFLGVSAGLLLLGAGGCQDRAVLKAEEDGLSAVRAGQYAMAEQEFAFALDKSPHRVPSRIGMAKALLGQNRPTQARVHLEAAYSMEPQNDEVIDLLAQAMLGDGKIDEMSRLLRGRAEESQSVKEWLRYGKWADKANDPDEAKIAFLSAARIDKGRTAEPQVALADLHLKIGDEVEALRRYRMALYLRPQDVVIQNQIRSLGQNPTPGYAIVPSEALSGE